MGLAREDLARPSLFLLGELPAPSALPRAPVERIGRMRGQHILAVPSSPLHQSRRFEAIPSIAAAYHLGWVALRDGGTVHAGADQSIGEAPISPTSRIALNDIGSDCR